MKSSFKLITALCVFISVMMLFSLSVGAKVYTGNHDNISWTFDLNNGYMEISGDGEIADYLNFASTPYAKYLPLIKSLKINEGITRIGNCAFMYAASLKSVVLPETLDSIGSCAFEYCLALEEIKISDNVTSIEDMAFSSCRALESASLPETLTHLGSYAFSDCSSLSEINIPSNLTEINEGTFSQCPSLKFPEGFENVQSIGEGAFYNCTSIDTDSFPESVTDISSRAFFGCSSFSPVIPDNVTAQSGAFFNSSVLFNVIWNIDGKKETSSVTVNTLPSYNGTPKKNSVVDGIYNFYGWDKSFTPVTGSGSGYTALFKLAKPIISADYTVSDDSVSVSAELDLSGMGTDSACILFAAYGEGSKMISNKRVNVTKQDVSVWAVLPLRARKLENVKVFIYTDSSFITPLGEYIAVQK